MERVDGVQKAIEKDVVWLTASAVRYNTVCLP